MTTPIERFSGRAADYARYRAGYPEALLDALRADTGLTGRSVVADVGSGTGISTGLLRRAGCLVHAIEPNAEMRAVAEAAFAADPQVRHLDATAEATALPDASVDLIVAAQAFHWFNWSATRREFRRILRPGGWVGLFWNVRREDSAFMRTYDALLQAHCPELPLRQGAWRVDESVLTAVFGTSWQFREFQHKQALTLEALSGMLRSTSYSPRPDEPGFAPMMAALKHVFEEHQHAGCVDILYRTVLYVGQLAP